MKHKKKKRMHNSNKSLIISIQIAVIYSIFGCTWVSFSDRLLHLFISDATTLTQTQTVKGWVFIMINAVLVFYLVRHYSLKMQKRDSKIREGKFRLHSSQNRFKTLIETTLDCMWEIDTEANLTYTGPQIKELLGYDPAEVIGKPCFSLMLPDEAETMKKKLTEHVKNETAFFCIEHINIHKDGRHITLESSGAPFYDNEGKLKGYRGADRDITERKCIEENRRKLEEQLRQSKKMEAIGQLAGGVAHDFNNLLAGILGNAEMLIMMSKEGTEIQNGARMIEKASHRAANLTRQLLAFSRKDKLVMGTTNLHSIIKDVTSLLSHSIDEGITVEQKLEAEQPEITGDSVQLQNTILNLAVNARDAMPSGGTLSILTKNIIISDALEIKPGKYLEITITDTGNGMEKEVQERIFEPFFTTKKIGHGVGLGLAGAYGCVKAHNGQIQVHSQPEQGTTFKILLPLQVSHASIAPVSEPTSTPQKGNGRILLIDDEDLILDITTHLLENLGYSVVTRKDGIEAIDYVEQHIGQIDLILLDIIMPRLDGKGAFMKIKDIAPEIPVLISSGFSPNETVQIMLENGAKAFLKKPYKLSELSLQISKFLPST